MSNYVKSTIINVNRNRTTTENVLQIAIELDIKVLVIQELWVIVRIVIIGNIVLLYTRAIPNTPELRYP